jgi:4-phytase/acid phosphatase
VRSRRIAAFVSLALSCGVVAQEGREPGGDLKYIVIISRHGVRAPTWTAEQLNRYSSQPWPKWDVNPGELTRHGRLLIKLLGAYDRAYLAGQGLLHSTGCADLDHLYIWSDVDQRTIETAAAFAESLLPGCGLKIHSMAHAASDPIFNPLGSMGKPDRAMALASIMGRIGGSPEELVNLHRDAFWTLQQVLLAGGKSQESLLSAPVSVVAGSGESLVDITGPIRTGSTLAENLLLEFADGRKGDDLGWGRLNAENLRQILTIHTAYAELARRTPYLARQRGSNLLFHVLASLEQAAARKPASGALGEAENRVLLLAGHDTNISNLSGMLGLNWLLPGYPADDTPPGGALVFELRQRGAEPPRVRTYYMAQSLDQMQNAVPLTLQRPPLRAPIFIPGCSGSSEGYECTWTAFRRVAEGAIDPTMVSRISPR